MIRVNVGNLLVLQLGGSLGLVAHDERSECRLLRGKRFAFDQLTVGQQSTGWVKAENSRWDEVQGGTKRRGNSGTM